MIALNRVAVDGELKVLFRQRRKVEAELATSAYDVDIENAEFANSHASRMVTDLAQVVARLRPTKWITREDRWQVISECLEYALRDSSISERSHTLWHDAHTTPRTLGIAMYCRPLDHLDALAGGGRIDAKIMDSELAGSVIPLSKKQKADLTAGVRSRIIEGLATQLEEQHRQALAQSEAVLNGFVERPEVMEVLDRALKSPARKVWIHGDPGVGKTTLIEYLLPRDKSKEVVWIDCDVTEGKTYQLQRQLSQILLDAKIGPAVNVEAMWMQLIDHLAGDSSPVQVVLDNVSEYVPIESFVARELKGAIALISRQPPSGRIRKYLEVCVVEDMKLDEACRLAQSLLPRATEAECQRLAEMLYRRPLLVSQAASAINFTASNVNDYLAEIELSGSLHRHIQSLDETQEHRITAHFRYLVTLLEQHDNALRLMRIVLMFQDRSRLKTYEIVWSEVYPDAAMLRQRTEVQLPIDVINHGLAIGASVFARGPLESIGAVLQLEIGRAFEYLAQLGLITVANEVVSIHPLTRSTLIQAIIDDTDIATESDVCKAIASRASQWGWQGGTDLPLEMIELVLSAINVVDRLMTFHGAQEDISDLTQMVLAIALRVCIQTQTDVVFTRYATFMIHKDPRQLVRLTDDGWYSRPASVSELEAVDPLLLAGSRDGLTALMTEEMYLGAAKLPGESRNTADEYSMRYLELGIQFPPPDFVAVDTLADGGPFYQVVSGPRLAEMRETLARQATFPYQNGRAASVGVSQAREARNLLSFGRHLASTGNIEGALQALLVGARGASVTGGDAEAFSVMWDCYLVAIDLLLRAGDPGTADLLTDELTQRFEERDPAKSSRRLRHRNAAMSRKMEWIFREKISRLLIQKADTAGIAGIAQKTLDESYAAVHEEYNGVGSHLHQTCLEQFMRLQMLFLVMYEITPSDNVDLSFFKRIADESTRSGERYSVRSVVQSSLVASLVVLAVEPESMTEMVAMAGVELYGEERFELVTPPPEPDTALRNICDFATLRANQVAERSHWHEHARWLVIAGSAALLAGDTRDSVVVRAAIDVATRRRRRDWQQMLTLLPERPTEVLALCLL